MAAWKTGVSSSPKKVTSSIRRSGLHVEPLATSRLLRAASEVTNFQRTIATALGECL